MKIRPILDRVLVEPIEKEKQSKGGIILNATNNERPEIATVVAIGEGKNYEGEKVDINLKIKDKVLFNKYAGTSVTIENKEYMILKYSDVLAIIDKE